jgi:hypothetical protein
MFDTPANIELTTESFAEAITQLPEFAAEWYPSAHERLWGMVPREDEQRMQPQLDAAPDRAQPGLGYCSSGWQGRQTHVRSARIIFPTRNYWFILALPCSSIRMVVREEIPTVSRRFTRG